ncbi:MAG: PQQ-binding-like beta-propeller repeat protein [Planctomycetaceae bacterium]|nr:PQQ-binding-like beta-propeller repeat protein [Planctomycetaceae bacterium]
MRATLLGLSLSCVCWCATLSAAEPWAQWRGPRGDGFVTDAPPPLTFSAQNVLWKTPLPGSGQSSPVIVDDRIYLTSYENRGGKRIVFAVNRADGKLLWQKTAWTGEPEPSHQLNGWASATCTTDGERVYAFFGKGGGLFCYSRDGELLWNKPLGDFDGPWGTAASPILFDDLVIQNCDSESNARLVAFNKLTGDIVWNTRREDFRGWSVPLLYRQSSPPQLLLNGQTGVRSYDPQTGKELWFCSSEKGRGEPTITPDDRGRVYVLNGLAGPMYSVLTDGKGDVSATKRQWSTPRKTGRDLPSPAVIGQNLLVMAMKGILVCYDTETGALKWEERVGGNYSSSPVVVNGKALMIAEEGETIVIDPAASEHIVARNTIGAPSTEIFRASLTPHDGQWLIRSDKTLYCVGAK